MESLIDSLALGSCTTLDGMESIGKGSASQLRGEEEGEDKGGGSFTLRSSTWISTFYPTIEKLWHSLFEHH